ncbi:MAG: hypothetical protein VX438_13495, partial [Planctomycetota bacterium]|nr:hypothetical protein [Planctomycetota bacterium]
MAKKPKLNLSGAGLKKLALDHCEKLVFGVCAAVLVLLAYGGYQKPVFDDSKENPSKLLQMAQRSKQRIDSTTWANDSQSELSFAKYRVSDNTVLERVKRLNGILLDSSAYPTFPPGEISLSAKPKRAKPEILAATDIRAQFSWQLFALQPGTGGSSQINDGAWALEEEKKEPKGASQDNQNNRGSSSSSSSMMEEEEDPEDNEGGERENEGAGMSGGGNGNMSGQNKSKAPANAKRAAESMLAELEGVPVDGKIPFGYDEDSESDIKPSVLRRPCVCVTALVPFKEQLKRYETALKGTRRYDPADDFPKYIGLVISRRIDGGEWKEITQEVQRFSKRATSLYYPSLVSDDQFDPFLNAAIPTFLNSDFDNFVMHPKSGLRNFLSDGTEDQESSNSSQKTSKSSQPANFEDFEDPDEDDPEGDENKTLEASLAYPTVENAPDFKQVRFFDLLIDKTIKPG